MCLYLLGERDAVCMETLLHAGFMADSTSGQKFVNQIAALWNLKIDYVVLNAGVRRYPNVSILHAMSIRCASS